MPFECISRSEETFLERPFLEEEIHGVIKEMIGDKALCLGVLPSPFFKGVVTLLSLIL